MNTGNVEVLSEMQKICNDEINRVHDKNEICSKQEIARQLAQKLKPYIPKAVECLNNIDVSEMGYPTMGNIGLYLNWIECNADKEDYKQIKTALHKLYKRINDHTGRQTLPILDDDIEPKKNRGRPKGTTFEAKKAPSKNDKLLEALQNTYTMLNIDTYITTYNLSAIRVILKKDCNNILAFDDNHGYYYPVIFDIADGYKTLKTYLDNNSKGFKQLFGGYKIDNQQLIDSKVFKENEAVRPFLHTANELDMRSVKTHIISDISAQFRISTADVTSILKATLLKESYSNHRRFGKKNINTKSLWLSSITMHKKTFNAQSLNRRLGTIDKKTSKNL